MYREEVFEPAELPVVWVSETAEVLEPAVLTRPAEGWGEVEERRASVAEVLEAPPKGFLA